MRRRRGAEGASLLSLVTLATACSLRPFTPSVSVAFATQDVPFPKAMAVPSAREVSARWELAANDPWARYEKSTLVAALDAIAEPRGRAELPDVTELDVLLEATTAARRLGEVGLPAGTLWLCDMRGAASVAFGAALPRYTAEPISPVLTFNNWPSEIGLVPAEETLAALVLMGPPRPQRDAAMPGASHPVFLLDSWRLAYRDDDPGDAYDNRYMLQPHDLPSVGELRRLGITRVVYLVESLDDTEGEEDDLHPVLRAWQASGIAVHFVDLAWLAGLERGLDWDRRLAPAALHVEHRAVLQDDPAFYRRARGGFGFAYGRPLVFPGGFSRSRGGYGHGGHGGHGGG